MKLKSLSFLDWKNEERAEKDWNGNKHAQNMQEVDSEDLENFANEKNEKTPKYSVAEENLHNIKTWFEKE